MEAPFKNLAVGVDKIRSCHNVGAIFRTAECAGWDKIYLGGWTCAPPDPRLCKVALGAESMLPWEQHNQLWREVDRLKEAGVTIAVLENNVPGTQSIFDYKPKLPLLLIVGHEVEGNSAAMLKRADVTLEIPQFGQKESLNVSVAFGVAAFALARNV